MSKELEDTQEALCICRDLLESEIELNERLSKSDYTKITRLEVIDDNGRAYTNYKCAFPVLSIQDEGRTIKIFIKNTKHYDKNK